MNKRPIIFAMPGNEEMAERLAVHLDAEKGEAIIRRFPDRESYVRILSDVRDRRVIIAGTMHHPDEMILPLYFLSRTAKSLGAGHVCLMAPYLAYMRQDKVFQPGEGVTSDYFASLVSGLADALVTVDPHLHRRNTMSEIYDIPCEVVHAAGHISKWVRDNIERPVLIGPDSESEQWVGEVAHEAGAPYFVLEKIRHGDRDVEIKLPPTYEYVDHTPVLVDDIISTGRTMIEAIGQLQQAGLPPAHCVGVHAIFAGHAYEDLKETGADDIITCNTIPHDSNGIDVSDLMAEGYGRLKAS